MLNDKINMNPSSLVNKKIKIGISDPWEFQDEVGHSEFTGDIKQVFIAHRAFESGEDVSETILIQLEQPFGFKKMKCEYILGSPRHEGKGIEELMKNQYHLILFAFHLIRANLIILLTIISGMTVKAFL